jgi:hypothetical protein
MPLVTPLSADHDEETKLSEFLMKLWVLPNSVLTMQRPAISKAFY